MSSKIATIETLYLLAHAEKTCDIFDKIRILVGIRKYINRNLLLLHLNNFQQSYYIYLNYKVMLIFTITPINSITHFLTK